MNRTAQQTAFIDALRSTGANLALVARAGCGKTTTILEAVDEYVAANPTAEITICCFNNGVKKEIAAKLVKRGHDDWKKVQASTTHAMGFGLVKFAFCPRSKSQDDFVDDKKVFKLINAKNDPVYSEYGVQIAKLVSLAKGEGFGFFGDVQIGDAGAWYAMAAHYDVNDFEDTSDMDRVIEAAQTVYRESLAQTDVVDFNDMILFPLVKNLRVKFQRDLIFVDEAQDTSRARRALIKKFVEHNGRIVVVGDDRQAIMGFAGASADALTEFRDDLRATVLPLNVTWRCPKAVVREAQKLVPDITAADNAPEGEVLRVAGLDLVGEFLPTDAILCRNVAPLVETAYALIRRGVACKVEGREIGTGLLRMVDRWQRIVGIAGFLSKLEDYEARECQKAVAKGLDVKVEEIKDRCETLRHICRAVQDKGLNDLNDVRAFINAMFADDVAGVLTLCTYHRSKGREWQRVMLLEHSKRCPSAYAKQEWQLRQEQNLAYVAITRAMQTLVFVG